MNDFVSIDGKIIRLQRQINNVVYKPIRTDKYTLIDFPLNTELLTIININGNVCIVDYQKHATEPTRFNINFEFLDERHVRLLSIELIE